MAGRGITIFTDEMVYSRLADELRRRGYDAVSCLEAGRSNQEINDAEQLAFATAEGRAILTANAVDFVVLDAEWKAAGHAHAGIMVYANIRDIGTLLRRVIAHLEAVEPETQHDILLWI